MNKYQEAIAIRNAYIQTESGTKCLDDYFKESFDTLQELVDKATEQENFDLKQKLNAEEEFCAMLKKKVKTQAEIIKSLAKALEDNEIDLSYLIFSYLTPEEYVYIREILPYSISLYTRSGDDE